MFIHMIKLKRPLSACLGAAFVPLLLVACGGSDAETPATAAAPVTQPAQAERQLQVSGALDRPATLTMTQLRALPAATQTVTYGSGSGTQTHTYVGTALWNLLDGMGIQTDAAVRNDVLGKYVLATGADGYKAVFSLGELKPDVGNRASQVVYSETVNGAAAPLAADGLLRATAPGDGKGGRYVSGLLRLDVRASGSAVAGTGGAPSSQFGVTGAVKQPAAFDLAALKALPAVTRTVGASTYTGVSLWNLLNTVGLATNPAVKNDVLAMYVVATGSDGYKALISLGEIEPGFGNQPDLIAYEMDGAPLTTSGFARLVLPNDGKAGRYVSKLISLEVFAAPPAQ
ncbi:molybdopterin-dependent oxidoreductase [Cupriavidus basilensis]|uniref:Molybdopterin-dependent oxidoreductase n=1 Tax=Cupriavidus basilensis TaxID=68895 RepID=A0ABT6AXV8_9BURK|nr:molybdopterin-dependent oxidoreductase [Cupriavidus basilensis]MDF3837465.1 molybdopterin-dependent oxidoreductase [Cupriavidus basilensis]